MGCIFMHYLYIFQCILLANEKNEIYNSENRFRM